MTAVRTQVHGHDFGERARVCGVSGDSNWDIVSELVDLTDQKETQIFRAILTQRQEQFVQVAQAQMAQFAERVEGRHMLEPRPPEQTPVSAMQPDAGARSVPAWCVLRSGGHGPTEVGAPEGASMPRNAIAMVGGQNLESGLAAQGYSRVSEHGRLAWHRDPELAREVLRSLREKDQLLSMGLSWLATEIDDAQEHVRQLCGAPALSMNPPCLAPARASLRAQAENQGSGALRSHALAPSTRAAQQFATIGMAPGLDSYPAGSTLSTGAALPSDLAAAQRAANAHARLPGSELMPGAGQPRESIRRMESRLRGIGAGEPARLRTLDGAAGVEASCDGGCTWAPLSHVRQHVSATQLELIKQSRDVAHGMDYHGCTAPPETPSVSRHMDM